MFNLFVDGVSRENIKNIAAYMDEYIELQRGLNKEVDTGFEVIADTFESQQEAIVALNKYQGLLEDSIAGLEAKMIKLHSEIEKLNNKED